MENRMEISQIVKINLPYDPAISPLGIYLKNIKTLIQKDICILMLSAMLFTEANIWKQPNVPQQTNG